MVVSQPVTYLTRYSLMFSAAATYSGVLSGHLLWWRFSRPPVFLIAVPSRSSLLGAKLEILELEALQKYLKH